MRNIKKEEEKNPCNKMLIPTNGNYTGGFLLQTMLYLSNFTDYSPNNTLEDYLHLPIGADTGNK